MKINIKKISFSRQLKCHLLTPKNGSKILEKSANTSIWKDEEKLKFEAKGRISDKGDFTTFLLTNFSTFKICKAKAETIYLFLTVAAFIVIKWWLWQ